MVIFFVRVRKEIKDMITELTPEQESKLAVYRDEGIKIGLCCDPVDFKKAKRAARACYKQAELKVPKTFFFSHSPISCSFQCAFLSSYKSADPKKVYEKGTLDDSLKHLDETVDYNYILSESFRHLCETDPKIKKYESYFWSLDWCGDVSNYLSSTQIYGYHDVSWLLFYRFLGKECGLECCDQLKPLYNLSKCCGWWAPFTDFAILQDRCREIHRNDEHRLHNENGMALSFRDGWGVYCINGVRVPGWLIKTPAEELDPRMIMKIENAQIRAEFVRKVGIDRCFYKLGKVIDQEGDYELGMLELGDGRTRPYLKMKNPSVPEVWHVEGVHPDCHTVAAALSWRNGTDDTPSVLT